MAKVLNITMTTLTPLYTGEVRQRIRNANKAVLPVRSTATGKIIIPFKGAIRAAHKALTNNQAENDKLFGRMGSTGILDIDFLLSKKDKNEIVDLATHMKLNQFGTREGDFRAEEVIEGSEFEARIVVKNNSDDAVKTVKDTLKYLEKKGIGGWTGKGYGKVIFTIQEQK